MACVLLLVFLALGVHLAIAFLVAGVVGVTLLVGFSSGIALLGQSLYYSIASPGFVCLPLFLLLGAFAAKAGFAARAYEAIYKATSGLPGSLGVATTFGCAGFSAISGSSLATAALFGKLAYPQMDRYKYNKQFSLGCIACAGTFACMIPPSGMFIVFGIFTGLSIGKLFMAGIIPGVMLAIIYALLIIVRVKLQPKLAPQIEEYIPWQQKLVTLVDLWPIILVAGTVLGGIYLGFFSPTEAAAAGALLVLILGILLGGLRHLSAIKEALGETALTTAMLFFLIITALFFSRFLSLTGIPTLFAQSIADWDVSKEIVLLMVLVFWFFLGMIIVQVGVFALTLPILFPIMVGLGFDGIWFCVIAMLLNEVAGVTPPVGLNVYALAGATGTRVEDGFAGVWPFLCMNFVVVGILFAFPWLPLILPNMMFAK